MITTTDYNILQARISRVFEIGDGDYGYGQIALSGQLDPIVAASLTDFNNLRTDILKARQHQMGVLSTLPIPSLGPSMSDTTWAKFGTVMSQVEASRLAVPPATQATRELLVATTVVDGEWNSTTTNTITVSFPDMDAMRNYFNTGSSIEFIAARTGGTTTTKNTAWTSLLTSAGTVSFKRTATSSNKTTGTAIGFGKLTDAPQVIFQKTIADFPSPNVYSISARLDEENVSIIFDITFTNTGANVTGIITTTVNSYHASGDFVSVPAPTALADIAPGLASPVFAVVKSANSISEGSTSVTFTVNATNFEGPLYWKIVGYGVTPADFDETKLLNVLDGSVTISNGTGSFTLTAATDYLTEGTERFNVEFRTDTSTASPIVAQISSSLETIVDLSLTPIVYAASYKFASQTVTSVNEGQSVTYIITTTGVKDGTEVLWSTKGLTPGITADDFEDKKLNGTLVINDNTASLQRTIVNDNAAEALESYQIILSTVNPTTGATKIEATSYLMQIIDTVVTVVEDPYLVTNGLTTTSEGSTVGIVFKITTPKLPLNTRLYWQTFADVGTLTPSDFNDNTTSGSVLITNQVGTVTRYAKADSLTEGLESFHLIFYSDVQMTEEKVQSNTVSITESVSYAVTRSSPTIEENGASVNFVVTTPAVTNGTPIYWATVSDSGSVTEADFSDNTLTGSELVYNNSVTIVRRAIKDALVEGSEQFHLVIRETEGGPIVASSQVTSITETVSYEILPQLSSIVEGPAGEAVGVEFQIKTPALPAGTQLYWEIVPETGSVTSSDFTDNRMSGTVVITNNAGVVLRTAVSDGLTEGDESFRLRLKTGSAFGTQVAISDPVIITEYVKYSITPSTTSMTEGGGGIQYNITTPKLPDNTRVYWTTLVGEGNITANDFLVYDAQGTASNRLDGYVTTLNSRASFIIKAAADSLTEGNETFKIELRTEATNGTVQAVTTGYNTISEIVSYQVLADKTTIHESTDEATSVVTFTVNTPKINDGTKLYWTTYTASGNVSGTDFMDGVTQGTVEINNNTGKIVRRAKPDNTTEGVDAFAIQLRTGSYTTEPVLATSQVVVIADDSLDLPEPEVNPPSYVISFQDNKTAYLEGETISVIVNTVNVLSGAVFYWTLFPSLTAVGDISPVSGTFTLENKDISNGIGTHIVELTAVSDNNPEATKAYIFELRTGAISGLASTVVATSTSAFTVNDQSNFLVVTSTRSVSEGTGGVTFTVTTPTTMYGHVLDWQIVPNNNDAGVLSDITSADFNIAGSTNINNYNPVTMSGVLNIIAGAVSFTLVTASDSNTEGNEKFHIEFKDNDVLKGQSEVVTISEIVSYELTTLATSVVEGNFVEYTFTTPKLKSDTVFKWTARKTKGNVDSLDFGTSQTPQNYGTFTVLATETSKTFTVLARSDNEIEDIEEFVIDITINATGQPVTLGTPCPPVTITDTATGYTIVPKVNNVALTTPYSVVEGTPIKFVVNTPFYPNGATIYWKATGTVSAADFLENTLHGPIILNGNTGDFTLTPISTDGKEGSETLIISLTSADNGTDIDAPGTVCGTVTITEPSTYTIEPSSLTLVEGTSVTFRVTTPKLEIDKSFNYRIEPFVGQGGTISGVDFVAASQAGYTYVPNSATGTVLVSASTNSGQFVLTAATGDGNENVKGESFKIVLMDGTTVLSHNDPIVTVFDPTEYTLVCDTQKLIEGNKPGAKFTLTTPTISTEKTLYWWAVPVNGQTPFDSSKDVELSKGTVTINLTDTTKPIHQGSFYVVASSDTLSNEGDSFKIKITKGSVITSEEVTLNSPVVEIVDAQTYSATAVPTKVTEGVVTTNSNRTVITVIGKSADVGTRLYWRVKGTGVTFQDFGLTGTSPVQMSSAIALVNNVPTATLTLEVIANQLNNTGGRTFQVEFSKTGGTAFSTIATSNAVIISDDSRKPPPATVFSVSYVPTTAFVVGAGYQSVECSIYPAIPAGSPIKWEIVNVSDSNIQKALQSSTSEFVTGTIKTGSTRVTGQAATNTSYAILKLKATSIPANPSGTFQVRFSTDDPSKPITSPATLIEKVSGTLNFSRAPVTVTFSEVNGKQSWSKPRRDGGWGYELPITYTLKGGGGQGGGYGTSHEGGKGGNGDLVTGTYTIDRLSTGIIIDFVKGGNGGIPYGWVGNGGAGGSAAVLTTDKNANIATAAGGGGGGSGGWDGGTGGAGSAPTGTTTSWVTATTAGKKAPLAGEGFSPWYPGSGGGGAGGGSFTTQGWDDDNDSRVQRLGGTGGKSFVPAGATRTAGGGGAGGAGGISKLVSTVEGTKLSTVRKDYSNLLNKYGLIPTNQPDLTQTSIWSGSEININPISPTDYIVEFAVDHKGWFKINGVELWPKGVVGAGSTVSTTVRLDSTWNKTIEIWTQCDGAAKYNATSNAHAFAARMYVKGTNPTVDANILWSTRTTAAIRSKNGFSGAVGEPAVVTITYYP